MSYDLVIKNGRIITAHTSYNADIAIQGEQIAAIGQGLSGQREIDASGKLVTPGAVDIHVHLEMPIGKFTSSDDFFTGTRAAAFGGTTAVVDFIERQPDETMLEALAARRALADPKVVIDYGLHMTIGPNDIAHLDEVPAVYEAGCGSFKLYMAYGLRLTDDQLLQALKAIGDVNGLPVVHAENWDVICALVAENLRNGRTTPHYHPLSRPALMEGEATGRVIDIATLVGTRLHIFHVTCDNTVQRIAAARARGRSVTGETCPQYLLMTQEAYDRPGVEGALPVCAPPIRYQDSQDALWRALGNGDLQIVTTDHCPFTRAEKETGIRANDFSQIPGGVPGIEMRYTAVYSQGVKRGLLTENQWVAACCTTPAQLAGFNRKGDILVGYDADLVIFDPDKEVTLSTDFLHENVDWTLYDGVQLQGWPKTTLSRGRVIVDDGEFVGERGDGRFIKRGFGD
ncbi:MAG: dihydropyrimidinase [Ardenticatenaceae bacterium]|nr:dihydropyrimidinase [Ardenticatenaceae bacterium]MCB9444709.1 dihydropyrimidinase [Ardenticatenaceae bacterium]